MKGGLQRKMTDNFCPKKATLAVIITVRMFIRLYSIFLVCNFRFDLFARDTSNSHCRPFQTVIFSVVAHSCSNRK